MIKVVLAGMCCLLLASCQTLVKESATLDLASIHNDTIVTCISSLDHSKLEYIKSNRHDVESSLISGFIISNIVDNTGTHVSINENEWTNYNCNEEFIP